MNLLEGYPPLEPGEYAWRTAYGQHFVLSAAVVERFAALNEVFPDARPVLVHDLRRKTA